jgi:hypothetical protein
VTGEDVDLGAAHADVANVGCEVEDEAEWQQLKAEGESDRAG